MLFRQETLYNSRTTRLGLINDIFICLFLSLLIIMLNTIVVIRLLGLGAP